jgi:hypothetical protein
VQHAEDEPLEHGLGVADVVGLARADLARGELDDGPDDGERVVQRRQARRDRGPAPMISTSRVCASSGKAASASRNVWTMAITRPAGPAVSASAPARRIASTTARAPASKRATMQSSLLSKCS